MFGLVVGIGGQVVIVDGFAAGVEIRLHARIKDAEIVTADIIDTDPLRALVEIIKFGRKPLQPEWRPDDRGNIGHQKDQQKAANDTEEKADPEPRVENDRKQAYGSLQQHLELMAQSHTQLQSETRNLVQALRRPEVRGQWGEITLKRLAELAGMVKHCDFYEQENIETEELGIIRSQPWRGTQAIFASDGLFSFGAHLK